MALTLYYHPLSSFCHKTLIALYENRTPFTPLLVDLGNEASRNAFCKVWSMGKFPVLTDSSGDRTIPETSIIIEYLDRYYPGQTGFIPADPDLARQTRLLDRFYDLHVQVPMQKIVGDRIRPADKSDEYGVEQAKAQLKSALDLAERDLANKTWAVGETFTLADCAAAPALFYANKVMPFGNTHGNATSYLRRLMDRPSYARVLKEAEPYFHMFPLEERLKPE
jgi:glutathione S-transferase